MFWPLIDLFYPLFVYFISTAVLWGHNMCWIIKEIDLNIYIWSLLGEKFINL